VAQYLNSLEIIDYSSYIQQLRGIIIAHNSFRAHI
jgi:hypothetical protein